MWGRFYALSRSDACRGSIWFRTNPKLLLAFIDCLLPSFLGRWRFVLGLPVARPVSLMQRLPAIIGGEEGYRSGS